MTGPDRQISVGLLAHVDAGKTTLSEAMLYRSGAIRRLGRVDHGDAFLDTDSIERERGITIFSKLARLTLEDWTVTLVDTPGHVDFSAETERSVQVMDYAVLVISGTEGVQSHTRTLWGLLKRAGVPVFLFVNKMDLPGADRAAVLAALCGELDPGCVDFGLEKSALDEAAATLDEAALDEYLTVGALSQDTLAGLIRERRLFPVCFGSALRLEGIDGLLAALADYMREPVRPEAFGARVYKIARDPQGARLSYLKVTGGSLRVKDALPTGSAGETEKVDQIRLYAGDKYTAAEEVPAGTVCAVTGLDRSYAGQALGGEREDETSVLEPVIRYDAILPEGTDPHTALACFRALEEEDPQLHVEWNGALGSISVRLMGRVQLEVLQRLLRERFALHADFGKGGVVYRETIRNTVEGVGHFEPLRHYAEVHLLLRPGEPGSGLVFDSVLSEDVLDRNWQRLILTHLEEKEHLGVLTGSPITDMRISLAAGAASVKHTEGGDFREATYRAVRQGLMQAESVLLEPVYAFRLELPADQLGRAITDLSRMAGQTDQPRLEGDRAVITGTAPVSEMMDYPMTLASYTSGEGRLHTGLQGYAPCHNAPEVIAARGYAPERDLENTPDSVFCAHGAGYPVKWDRVPEKMHLESVLKRPSPLQPEESGSPAVRGVAKDVFALDKELIAIFERTYGKVRREGPGAWEARKKPARPAEGGGPSRRAAPRPRGPEYLLVDGYNIIFAWDELRELARDSVDTARQRLMDVLANLRGLRGNEIILVFDAYRVPGGQGSVEEYHGISVVYTREAETADAYIEKTAHRLTRDHRVVVASSDGPEQLIILGEGALRMTAGELKAETEAARREMEALLSAERPEDRNRPLREALQAAAGEDIAQNAVKKSGKQTENS